MMHGWVRAESDPGKGTRVSFGFYQKQVMAEISEPRNIGREILKEQSDPQVEEIQPNWIYPRARVLLVDDMEANRVIFQELAAPWKFILDLAVSGEEAVQMVKEREYQMIILDQMMPGMSGFETADQIQRYSHAPLVLMTADISDEVRSRSIRHGFTDFMPKPIRLQRMRQVLETGIPVRYRELPNPVDASKKAKATGRGTLRISVRWNLIGKRWRVYFRNFRNMSSGICICFRQKFMESKGSAARLEKRRLPSRQKLWRWRQRPKTVPL